ncbi:hypothetical protein [Agrobacterium sp. LMR679]|uniref:hypothetical protein n=1 Tax=Agrobacterium sp. LMR679 TaxID=3014335 RepID=UPI0022AF73C9|nr:hypothetical protein [Agrobacterium sp. LMR679]MCZ4076263.1 hypothetical protein [Agrobacterium sp. LMR679]
MVETIGEAFNADWQLFARCVDGRVDLGHAALKCEWRYDLDMMTLVATRGRDFRWQASPAGCAVLDAATGASA